MTTEKKRRLQNLLSSISTPNERNELQKLDHLKVKEITDFFSSIEADNEAKIDKMEKTLVNILASFESYRKASGEHSKHLVETFGSFTDKMVDKLKELGGTFSTSFEKNKPVNMAGVYKDMINQLSGVKKSIDEKPVPVWSWPQYASVGVRNKNFSNIDPAQNDIAGTLKIGTTTVTSAGTAVQISATSVPCYAVYVQAHESNTSAITVGDSTVVAALSGRKGITLYPTNSQKFVVSDLNMLYVDAITNSDKAHWYVEKA